MILKLTKKIIKKYKNSTITESSSLVWCKIKWWNWVHLGISWLSQQPRVARQCLGALSDHWKNTLHPPLLLEIAAASFSAFLLLQNSILGHRRAVEKPNSCFTELAVQQLWALTLVWKHQILFSLGKSWSALKTLLRCNICQGGLWI